MTSNGLVLLKSWFKILAATLPTVPLYDEYFPFLCGYIGSLERLTHSLNDEQWYLLDGYSI